MGLQGNSGVPSSWKGRGKGGEKWEGTKKGGHKDHLSYLFPDKIYREDKLTNSVCFPPSHLGNSSKLDCIRFGVGYLLNAVATSTATATVAPTIGLLPMPRKPIISTWAGTDEEPAN